jgi:hypothetical protein
MLNHVVVLDSGLRTKSRRRAAAPPEGSFTSAGTEHVVLGVVSTMRFAVPVGTDGTM